MPKLLLNPQTKHKIVNFINDPSHALLLVGDKGAGKSTVALNIALSLLKLPGLKSLYNYPYWLHVNQSSGAITIDDIRQLKASVNLKTTGSNRFRRVVFIQDADLMTTEAQSALLKLLEEPPLDTLIILSAVNTNKLLGTIISRVSLVSILPVNKQQAAEYLNLMGLGVDGLDRHILISEGLAGVLISLQAGEQNSGALFGQLQDAKQIIRFNLVERLLLVDTLVKDKLALDELLNSMRKLVRASQRLALNSSEFAKANRLLGVQKAIHNSRQELAKNANPKLVLSKLMTLL